MADGLSRIWNNTRRLGSPEFSKAELGRWLREQSIGGAGLAWRCVYTGEVLSVEEISLDHRQPREQGGRHALSNLAITSERTNRIKGKLSDAEFGAILDLMNGRLACQSCGGAARRMPFGVRSLRDVMRRLGQKPSFRFPKKKKVEKPDGEDW